MKTLNLKKYHVRSLVMFFIAIFGVVAMVYYRKATASSCVTPSGIDAGTVVMTANVSNSGKYRIWNRIMASGTGSYQLEVDQNKCYSIDVNAQVPANKWTWINYSNGDVNKPIDVDLAAGVHTVKLVKKDKNIKLDRILVLSDLKCEPSDTGANCAGINISPKVSITSPSSGYSVNAPGVVDISASASDSDGSVMKVEFYNGSKLLATTNKQPYAYKWTGVAAGSYTISARAYDNDGGITNSSGVAVKVNASTPSEAMSVKITASNDTYISSDNPNSSYGKATELKATASAYRTFLRFDTKNRKPPVGKTLTSAKLRVFTYRNKVNTGGYEIHESLIPWDPDRMTWNNQGSAYGKLVTTSSTPKSGQWMDISLPLNAVPFDHNAKFGIRYTVTLAGTSIGSVESSHKPQLILEYK